MRNSLKWLIWIFVLMIVAFVVSGVFFLRSGLIDLETGKVNQEGLNEMNLVFDKYSKIFGEIDFSESGKYSLDWENLD